MRDQLVAAGSAGLGALMIVFAVLFATLDRFVAMKWARYCILPFVLTGIAALATAKILFGFSLHGVVHTGMNKAEQIGGTVTSLAWILPIALAIVALGIFINDAWSANVQRRSLIAAGAVPLTVAFIPGAFGSAVMTLLGFIPVGLVMWLFQAVFNGVGRAF